MAEDYEMTASSATLLNRTGYRAFAMPAVSTPLFLKLAAATVATGVVVWKEPAPYDLALVALLVIGVYFGKLAFRREHALPALFLIGFGFANLLPLVNATNLQAGIMRGAVTLYLLASWFFFVGVSTRYGPRAVDLLIRNYVVAGAIVAVLSTLAYAGLLPGLKSTLLMDWRSRGFFKDPNVYGPYLVYVAVFAISRWDMPMLRFRNKAFWGAVLVSAVVGVFLSYSRASWLNLGISVVTYFGLRVLSGSLQSAGRALAFVACIGVVVFAAMNVPQVRWAVDVRVAGGGLQPYDFSRFQNQQFILQTALDHPFGIGPGQAELLRNYSVHSTYIQLLCENGIAGLLCYLCFVLLTGIRCIRLALSARSAHQRVFFAAVGACIAGFLVNSAVIDVIHWRHIWFWFALGWAAAPEAGNSRVAFPAKSPFGRFASLGSL
jgi:O-antigen ligase